LAGKDGERADTSAAAERMKRLTAAVVLPIRFVWALLGSGVQTVGVILRSGLGIGTPPAAGFVRFVDGRTGCRSARQHDYTHSRHDGHRHRRGSARDGASHARHERRGVGARRDPPRFRPAVVAWFGVRQ
jgi:hypothetical protein